MRHKRTDLPTQNDRHLTRLIAHTAAHGIIDFSCFYILFARFYPIASSAQQITVVLVLYGVIAFGLQPMLGFLTDHFRGFPAVALGCLLVLIGVCLPGEAVYAAIIFAALGNAFFYTDAGADILLVSRGRMFDSGLFISAGALGVAFGTLAGRHQTSGAVPIILVSLILLIEWWMPLQQKTSVTRFWTFSGKTTQPTALLLLLVAVAIRAFVGGIVPMPWKITDGHIIWAAVGAAGGKLLGGLLADLFGARRVGVIALMASIPLLCLLSDSPLFCTIGIFLFNIPMPITLCTAADLLPLYPGFAFGLTALTLLLGSLPIMLTSAIPTPAFLIVLFSLAAALCLGITTRNNKDMYHSII